MTIPVLSPSTGGTVPIRVSHGKDQSTIEPSLTPGTAIKRLLESLVSIDANEQKFSVCTKRL